MGISLSIQVCLILQMTVNYKENGGKKSFSCKSKALVSCIPMRRTWLQCPKIEKMEIIMSIQGWFISRRNINYKENGRKKVFLANPKHQHQVSQYGEHDCSASKKKNGDYNKHPSLSHFTDEL